MSRTWTLPRLAVPGFGWTGKKPAASPSPPVEPTLGRVPLARIEIKKMAVPIAKASGKAGAARPQVGTHMPPPARPAAATSAGTGSRARRGRTVAELDAELSQLPEEDYAALRQAEPRVPSFAVPDEPAAPRRKPRKTPARDADADGQFVRGDERFLAGLKQAQLIESSPRALWALYLMAAIVVTAAVWGSVAQVDIITHATGKVVPEGREQVINSLEGGILRAMHVREGAVVEVGEELVQLDPTRFAAQQNEGQAKRIALKGTIARLSAEAYGRPLNFPAEVRVEPAIVSAETEAFDARRRSLDEAVSVNRRSMVLLQNELDTASRMASQGLMSEVEVMRLRRQSNDLLLQNQERINRFRQDASTELLRAKTELAQIDEQQVVKEDALKRTTLKSPVRGIVKNVNIGTIGGVVGAGAAIMEIVPIGDHVLVEARIKPADIGFVRVGLPAEVKLSAYDFVTYGGLKGTIEYISPDAITDDKPAPGGDTSYYRARIRTAAPALRSKDDKPLPVLPGMTATVEIRTGDRTVMDFLLKPMLKSREAFTEH
jgi:adhesin transport system membrane fusion protein